MNWSPSPATLARIKLALIASGLLPAAALVVFLLQDDPGANPVEWVQRHTGSWALKFLLITLCITPLRHLLGAPWLIRLRRSLGLLAFFYALLHGLAFIGFDHAFVLQEIARDIVKRPFVSAGFAAFVLLVPLAATSNSWSIRRLGGRRWQALHYAIYPAAILACLHYLWLVKATALIYPLLYSLALALLLAWRVQHRRKQASMSRRA